MAGWAVQCIGEPPHNSLYKPGWDDLITLMWALVFMSEAPCYGTRVRGLLGDCVYIHTEFLVLWCMCVCLCQSKWYVRFRQQRGAIQWPNRSTGSLSECFCDCVCVMQAYSTSPWIYQRWTCIRCECSPQKCSGETEELHKISWSCFSVLANKPASHFEVSTHSF